jgi:hypothetical protein
MRKYFMPLVLVLLHLAAVAQNGTRPDSLSYSDMLSDFRYYVDLLEKTHVDPYSPMGGKLKFMVRVAMFEQRIPSRRASAKDFALLLSEFSSALNDNHSHFQLPKSSQGAMDNRQMPFYLKASADGLFIEACKEKYANLYGAKILEVNKIPVAELLVRIKTFSPCENISNAMANLAWHLVNYKLATALFPEMKDSLCLKLVSSRLDTLSLSLEWAEAGVLSSLPWHPKPRNMALDNTKGIFSYQYVGKEKNIMYYSLKEMFSQEVVQMIKAYKANHGNWQEWMLGQYYPELKVQYGMEEGLRKMPYFTASFRDMLVTMKGNKSKYLILDLTQNGGGYSSMATPALYMLFGDKSFSPELEGKRAKRISQLYLDKFNTTLAGYNQSNHTNYRLGDYDVSDFVSSWPSEGLESTCKNIREEYFRMLTSNNFGWTNFISDLDGKALYTPEIIVLTSAKTNSAAYHFLYRLYKMAAVWVVGVAPSQAGNTAMENTPFVLPVSRLEGSIANAYQQFFPEDDPKAHLFMPDFPLAWKDYQRTGFSATAELEICLELLKTGKFSSNR